MQLSKKENQKAVTQSWTQLKADVGQRVKTLRLKKGLTQVELARRANIGRVKLVLLEGGEENITLQTLCKIAQALDCKPVVDIKNQRS